MFSAWKKVRELEQYIQGMRQSMAQVKAINKSLELENMQLKDELKTLPKRVKGKFTKRNWESDEAQRAMRRFLNIY